MTHPLTNALAMRTAAADVAIDNNACCPDCAEQAAAAILALPLEADHAAMVAEAVRLPEIAALIEAVKELDRHFIPFSDDEFKAEYALHAALSALETP